MVQGRKLDQSERRAQFSELRGGGVVGRNGYFSGRLRRPMFVTGFVNLYTRDIEASLRFYEGLLGFRETFRTPTVGTPTHVEMKLNDFALGLGSVDAARRVHGVEASPGAPAVAIVIWTDDVDGSFQTLTRAGVEAMQPPHPAGNRNRSALLKDPDGNLVEIVARV